MVGRRLSKFPLAEERSTRIHTQPGQRRVRSCLSESLGPGWLESSPGVIKSRLIDEKLEVGRSRGRVYRRYRIGHYSQGPCLCKLEHIGRKLTTDTGPGVCLGQVHIRPELPVSSSALCPCRGEGLFYVQSYHSHMGWIVSTIMGNRNRRLLAVVLLNCPQNPFHLATRPYYSVMATYYRTASLGHARDGWFARGTIGMHSLQHLGLVRGM